MQAHISGKNALQRYPAVQRLLQKYHFDLRIMCES